MEKFFYKEPVEIEIYLKKLGRIRTIVKDMEIELIDEEPVSEKSRIIFDYFKKKDEPVDLVEIQKVFPEMTGIISESYYTNRELFAKLSLNFKRGLAGSTDAWRTAIYFTELLLKYEPTIASSMYIGNFNAYNLNYLIKKLNSLNEKFLLEDQTVLFLIKKRNSFYKDAPPDRQFNKLVELWKYHIKSGIYS